MNILLICDDENFAKIIEGKLFFLRNNDKICKSSYKEALNDININPIQTIIIRENKLESETLDLISNIRENFDTPIILVSKNCGQEFILSAYDAGINDFVSEEVSDYELVLRVISSIKYNSLNLKNNRYKKILEQLKVIDNITGVYSYNYAKQVIENYIDLDLISDGSFMIISPSNEGKLTFSAEKLKNAIKSSIRIDDILTLGNSINFYIFLPNTDMNGAVVVYNKIKNILDFDICAGITDISGKTFEQIERESIKALSEAMIHNKEYTLTQNYKEETLDDWIDDKGSQNYKIFKQMFNKKLEKVISPVFYRLQNTYEEKLFNTEIEQYITEDQCIFSLKNKNGNAFLKIIYPGFAKITILISYEGLDSPENREIKLPLAHITQKGLVKIIEDFIKEYKENVIR